MTVTTTGLTKASGIAAAAAGAIFIGVQIGHPGFDTFVTDTNEWVIRCSAKSVMTVLALVGITGMYLRQVRQMRAFLSALTDRAPAFAKNVVIASGGGHPTGDIGHLQTFFDLTGACYLLGGLIFGIALFRAGVLARWAAVLLAVSTVATAALAVLPASFDRPMAVPEGVALIGLGISLWRDQRRAANPDASPTALPMTAAAR
jgi:hypothetical protein